MGKLSTVNYFGRKSAYNIDIIRGLMPAGKIGTIVDGCFGSGAATIGLFSLYDAAKVGIDLNRAVITMHEMIRDRPFDVLETVRGMEYSQECYDRCLGVLERYERGEDEDEVLVAASKLAVLYMSRNSMEGIYRDIKKYDEPLDRGRCRVYWNKRLGLYEKALQVVLNGDSLRDVTLIHGDFMDYPEYWEDSDTFIYLDVPYPLDGRGIKDRGSKKGKTGYATDWTDSDQETFLDRIAQMHDSGKLKAKLMVCSNFEVDDEGKLVGLAENIYNQALLPRGFRMVVTERKYACEPSKAAGGRKRRKAEVVWVNYENIAGLWSSYEYYDYEDVYGKVA